MIFQGEAGTQLNTLVETSYNGDWVKAFKGAVKNNQPGMALEFLTVILDGVIASADKAETEAPKTTRKAAATTTASEDA